jgi:AcrR family transcriptional regulator
MARVLKLKGVSAMVESPKGRDELVEVAVDLFAKNGFAGTSIRDIAAAVGRSVSNVYHYFENKEALWLAILEYSVKALPEKLHAALADKQDPLERLTALVRAHLEASVQHHRESKIFFIDEERLSPMGKRANRRVQKEVLEIYVGEIERLKAAGIVRTGETKIMAFNVLGVVNWHLRWFRPVGKLKEEQVFNEIIGFIMRAVREAPPGS